MKYTYKIVAAVLALIVVVVLAFAPIIYVGIDSIATQLLLTIGQYAGNETAQQIINEKGQITSKVGIDVSFAGLFDKDAQELAELVRVFSEGDNENTMEVLQPVIAPAITFVIVLILLAVCAFVTAIVAIAAKDNRKVIYTCVVGAGLSLMVPQCFKAVAAPFVNGEITLANLSGNSWLTLLGEIEKVELVSIFWFVPVAFVAVILWTVLYNYTLPADEKKKRLELIGEADSE